MTTKDLRAIVGDLENACARLDYVLIEEGDDPVRLAQIQHEFGNTLIESWYRLTSSDPTKPRVVLCAGCGGPVRVTYRLCDACQRYEQTTGHSAVREPGWAAAKRLARESEPTDF